MYSDVSFNYNTVYAGYKNTGYKNTGYKNMPVIRTINQFTESFVLYFIDILPDIRTLS